MTKRIAFGLIGNVPVRIAIELAQTAEKYEYDSFWMHETYFQRDALSYLSAIALATSRIRLATGCINPFTRHPVLIAMSAATLNEASSGRMILGIGTGFLPKLDQMGIPHARPVAFLKESIEIVRRLLQGESVTFQGRHYSLREVKPVLPKSERSVPIYLAGWKKQMLQLAGRLADGYLARPIESIQSLTALSDSLMEACGSSGRDPSTFEKAAYLLCSVKKKSDEAKQAMRNNSFTIYQFAVMEDYVLSQTGFDPEVKKRIAEPYWKGDLPEASKQISDELLDAFTASGNEDEVVARINDYSKVALPILQPIGVDSRDIQMVLEAGRSYLNQ
jgi:5,10-methylenetetrahydromethanopterin reductase